MAKHFFIFKRTNIMEETLHSMLKIQSARNKNVDYMVVSNLVNDSRSISQKQLAEIKSKFNIVNDEVYGDFNIYLIDILNSSSLLPNTVELTTNEIESPLKMVAKILDIELNEFQLFIDANHVGYIPKMYELGKSLELEKYQIDSYVSSIRFMSRSYNTNSTQLDITSDIYLKSLSRPTSNEYITCLNVPFRTLSDCIMIIDELYSDYKSIIIVNKYNNTLVVGSEKLVKWIKARFLFSSYFQIQRGIYAIEGFPPDAIEEIQVKAIEICE